MKIHFSLAKLVKQLLNYMNETQFNSHPYKNFTNRFCINFAIAPRDTPGNMSRKFNFLQENYCVI